MRRTNVCLTTELSYEALNRQFIVGAVIGWRSCLSWATTIFMSSVTVICRVLFCLACVSGVLFFFKRWKFFKNNFSFGLALQALLKTLVVLWLVRFLIVLANCVRGLLVAVFLVVSKVYQK